jgi:2,5-dioxopentanoate dehydrogenase
LGIASSDLDSFIHTLANEIEKIAPASMLNSGIYTNYAKMREQAISQQNVNTEAVSKIEPSSAQQGIPTVASVSGDEFLKNTTLHQEVFGPYSLIVKCKDLQEIKTVIEHLEGQLTATFMATEAELLESSSLVEALRQKCGRLLFNGVPTGVEVSAAMHHGGPFPSSTDSRFTSVGPDSIKRFVRPASYQSFPDALLPDELKHNNPLNIWRLVNNNLQK